MNARTGLRERWLSPPRSGTQRLIAPYEYRHLVIFGITRIAGGIVTTGIGAFILSYSAHGWAALFLALGVGNLLGGYWYLTVARSQELGGKRSGLAGGRSS
jgi:hypothetical protein